MKFFVDTADIHQIKNIHEWFHLDGVTTNPTLVAQSTLEAQNKISHHKLIQDICKIVPKGSISAEVLATDTDGMCKEAQALCQLNPQVVAKIPLIKEGLTAVKHLAKKNIPTNVTLCFSAVQAMMAAHQGANIVSIFVGRLDDIGIRGMEIVEDVVNIYAQYQIKTKVLVASVRHTFHITEALQVGADIITIPPTLFAKMPTHPLSQKGLEQFLKSANKI